MHDILCYISFAAYHSHKVHLPTCIICMIAKSIVYSSGAALSHPSQNSRTHHTCSSRRTPKCRYISPQILFLALTNYWGPNLRAGNGHKQYRFYACVIDLSSNHLNLGVTKFCSQQRPTSKQPINLVQSNLTSWGVKPWHSRQILSNTISPCLPASVLAMGGDGVIF